MYCVSHLSKFFQMNRTSQGDPEHALTFRYLYVFIECGAAGKSASVKELNGTTITDPTECTPLPPPLPMTVPLLRARG